MKRTLFSFAAVLSTVGVVALGSLSCSSPTAPLSPTGKSGVNAQGLQLVVTATKGDGNIAFAIGVENGGPAAQTLQFTSGQFFDIEVTDHWGKLVWRWSNDKAFTQALWALELAAGKTSSQQTVWDLTGNDGKKLPSGSYTAKISITSNPRDEALAVEIGLTI